jgi:hypothetical protein
VPIVSFQGSRHQKKPPKELVTRFSIATYVEMSSKKWHGLVQKVEGGRRPDRSRAMTKSIRLPRFREDTRSTLIHPLSPNASVGQRWRFRRDVVIYVASRSGISQRSLAEVFDLGRSRIAKILEEFSRIHQPSRLRDDPRPTSIPPPPANASPGQLRRFRRNVVISIAARGGISKRILSEVFDLPRSRIAKITKETQF